VYQTIISFGQPTTDREICLFICIKFYHI